MDLRRSLSWLGRDSKGTATVTVQPHVVSFATDDWYWDRADALRKSAHHFGLPLTMLHVRDRGSWLLNCHHKAQFCLAMSLAFDAPILWIDADAEIKQMPIALLNTDVDVAIHLTRAEDRKPTRRQAGRTDLYHRPSDWPTDLGGWVNSGTCYFAATDAARKVLMTWVKFTQDEPAWMGQWHLQSAWSKVNALIKLNTMYLPETYCSVFGPGKNAVIRHGLASRERKVARQ